MTKDADVTQELIETLEDGREGFAKAAEKLKDSDAPQLAPTFERFSQQRAQFSDELRQLAQTYGDQVDQSGTVLGTLHRGWLSLKDALTGSNPHAVIDAAEQGEDHAVSEYNKALAEDISPQLRVIVERQAVDVKAAHDEVRALRDSVA